MDNGILADRIARRYEHLIQKGDRYLSHFDKIGFMNVGHWQGIADNSIEKAQINLVESLISFFYNTGGSVLDVTCGKGASSKFLTKYFDARQITGINISERQLETCRVIAPECNFRLMDATSLDFGNSSFDNLLCIEAAFHFLTRQNSLRSQSGVKPSGRLAMFDVLFDYDVLETLFDGEDDYIAPRDNFLPNLDAYRDSLLQAGFSYVRVDDCTDITSRAACSYVIGREQQEFGRTHDPAALELIKKKPLKRPGPLTGLSPA
jgi:MPBQ/MSBQ methyltransferase